MLYSMLNRCQWFLFGCVCLHKRGFTQRDFFVGAGLKGKIWVFHHKSKVREGMFLSVTVCSLLELRQPVGFTHNKYWKQARPKSQLAHYWIFNQRIILASFSQRTEKVIQQKHKKK